MSALRLAIIVLCTWSVSACASFTPARSVAYAYSKVPASAHYNKAEPGSSQPSGPSSRWIVVQPGDTLSSIASRYGTSSGAIARANRLYSADRIYPGQRLIVPSGGSGGSYAEVRPSPKPAPVSSGGGYTGGPYYPVSPSPKPSPGYGGSGSGNGDSGSAELASFAWPVRGRVISGFGSRANGQRNDGINIAADAGAPVRAAADGTVTYAGSELKGYGNLVLIRHPQGYVTAYAHNSRLAVEKGDKVRRGDVIAYVGATGGVDSPQLHFEIRKGVKPVDPKRYLGDSYASN